MWFLFSTFGFVMRRSLLGVRAWRSFLGVQRSAFVVQRSVFCVWLSVIGVQHSAFDVRSLVLALGVLCLAFSLFGGRLLSVFGGR